MSLLEINHLSKKFGGLMVLEDVSLVLEKRTIMGLIGPNGAGKTTLINVLTGLYGANSGEVLFKEKDITGLKAHKVVSMGIARTFQTTRLFYERTVLENVLMAQHKLTARNQRGCFLDGVLGRKINADKAEEIVQFMGLFSYRRSLAKNIPLAQQRVLAISLALATEPELIILDEPGAGMNPLEIEEMMALIQSIRSLGKAIFLIEHNMKMVMSVCEKIVVLNFGRKIAEGTAEEISENKIVIEAYLGENDDS